jgi:hypothetical protein
VDGWRRPAPDECATAAPLGSLVTRDELATTRLIKIDVEGAEDRVLVGMLGSVDALAADAEIFVEVNATFWSDPQLRPIDVLRPFLDRGFHVYLVPAIYWPWRYLWSKDVRAAAAPRKRGTRAARKARHCAVTHRCRCAVTWEPIGQLLACRGGIEWPAWPGAFRRIRASACNS